MNKPEFKARVAQCAALFVTFVVALLLAACSSSASADPQEDPSGLDESSVVRLTTNFTGLNKPLGYTQSDTGQPLPKLTSIGSASQYWKLAADRNDLYKIVSATDGAGLVLTLGSQAENYKPQLTADSSSDEQLWKFSLRENGSCRITPYLLGAGQSLDIVNDDFDIEIRIADSGNYSGQSWNITLVDISTSDMEFPPCIRQDPDAAGGENKAFTPTEDYLRSSVHGFDILINPVISSSAELLSDVNAEVERQLRTMTQVIPEQSLMQIQATSIWVELSQLPSTGGQFHHSVDWLTANGYNAEKANSVEISNVRVFLKRARNVGVSTLLHELAHARQFYLKDNSAIDFITPYQLAVASGVYNSVEYIRGGMRPAYSLTNEREYFAELTEAYFGTNDFFPFSRHQLEDFDKPGYDLIREAWLK